MLHVEDEVISRGIEKKNQDSTHQIQSKTEIPKSTIAASNASNVEVDIVDVNGSEAKRTRGLSTTSNIPVSNTRDAVADVDGVDVEVVDVVAAGCQGAGNPHCIKY